LKPAHGGPIMARCAEKISIQERQMGEACGVHGGTGTRILEERGYSNSADPWKEAEGIRIDQLFLFK